MKITFFSFFSLLLSLTAFSQPEVTADTVDGGPNVFLKVEKEAEFPGGVAGWRVFLEKNLNPAVPVDNGAPAGRYTVFVQFVVSKDGSIADIKPLTNNGYGMEGEVLRIIRKSGKWTPAMQNGRPVNAYRKQPVIFQVEDESIQVTTSTPYTIFTEIDNPVTIKVDKLKDEDVVVTTSQGSVTNLGNGRYILRTTKPGRVILSISNNRKKKEVGKISLEATEAPDQ